MVKGTLYVQQYIHPNTGNLIFLNFLFLVIFPLFHFKLKLIEMFMGFKGEKQEVCSSLHLLFKQVLIRKVTEKGRAVGEHQVNKTNGEILGTMYPS